MRKNNRTYIVTLLLNLTLISARLKAAEEFNSDPENTVVTPTKMTQAVKDVPAAVTIIEGDTIQRLGIATIPDALRLVPGMVVAQGSNWDYRTAYHGTNNYNTRRMQVLVDGMSVYRSGLATVEWSMLPVPIKDISRIEITRDPSSASYGSNAFQAVVNIITKSPAPDVNFAPSTFAINTARDSRGTNRNYLHYENSINTALFGVSIEHTKSNGFYSRDIELVDLSAAGFVDGNDSGFANDGSEYLKLAINNQYDINAKNSIQLHWGGVKSHQDQNLMQYLPQVTHPDNTATDNFFNISYTSDQIDAHRIKLEFNRYQTQHTQEWTHCYSKISLTTEMATLFKQDPAYADTLVVASLLPSDDIRSTPQYQLLFNRYQERPTVDEATEAATLQTLQQKYQQYGTEAFSNVCGTINQNYIDSKNTFEIQDTWAINNSLRAVTGVGEAHNATDSQTFLGGTVELRKRWAYTNVEWRPSAKLTANAGTMLERDDIDSTFYDMPRAAIGYDFLPDQTVKFVVASSKRTPDLTETNLYSRLHIADLEIPVDGANSAYYYRFTKSKTKLDAESDLAKSLIWLGRIPDAGLSYEVKVFKEKMSDLISENFSLMITPTNDGKVEMSGAEYQIKYKFSPQLTLLQSYAYLDQNANNMLETQLYARHSGSLALLADIGKYQYSFSYYGTDFKNADAFDEFDLMVGRKYAFKNQSVYWRGKLNYYPDNSFSELDAALTKATYRYRREVGASIEMGIDW